MIDKKSGEIYIYAFDVNWFYFAMKYDYYYIS